MTGSGHAAWETHAAWWVENFTSGSDPVYSEQILPLAVDLLAGSRRVLDLGCGDGQVGRALSSSGSTATWFGSDPSASLTAAAIAADPDARVVRAVGDSLPFEDEAFDAVAVVLVLEHVVDLAGTCAELARVCEPGGRLLLFLNHPLFQAPGAGWIEDHVVGEAYWRIGSYLVESDSEEEVDPGVFLPFRHRPLSVYVNAVVDAGFDLRRLVEPAPPGAYLAVDPALEASAGVPRLLVVVAERRLP